MLTPEAIEEFRKLYQGKFGINLTDDKALDLGSK